MFEAKDALAAVWTPDLSSSAALRTPADALIATTPISPLFHKNHTGDVGGQLNCL